MDERLHISRKDVTDRELKLNLSRESSRPSQYHDLLASIRVKLMEHLSANNIHIYILILK